MLSSTHNGVYDNNPWENCNPLCSSISPCYNAYDSWLQMMADDGHERLPNMGPGNLLSAQHACLRYIRWSHFQPTSSSLTAQPSFLFQDAWLRGLTACPRGIVPLSSPIPPPDNSAVGPERTTVAARSWRGWVSPEQHSGSFESPLPPFPACPQHLFSSPHKGKPQEAWLRVLRKSRFEEIHRTLDGKSAKAAMYRALLSHLEWELQAPDLSHKRVPNPLCVF